MNVCPIMWVASVLPIHAEALARAFAAHQLECAFEEPPRRRLVQPDRVVIHDAPGGEDDRERVDHQRRIEVLQVA